MRTLKAKATSLLNKAWPAIAWTTLSGIGGARFGISFNDHVLRRRQEAGRLPRSLGSLSWSPATVSFAFDLPSPDAHKNSMYSDTRGSKSCLLVTAEKGVKPFAGQLIPVFGTGLYSQSFKRTQRFANSDTLLPGAPFNVPFGYFTHRLRTFRRLGRSAGFSFVPTKAHTG